MSEPYVTIGGKQVHPRPPSAAESHPSQRSPVAWEEGWQRETTRASVPVGTLFVIALAILVIIKLVRRRSSRR